MTITLKPTASETTIQNNGSDIFTIDSTGLTMASGKLLASTGPAFSAYASADQTVSNGTWTKVVIDTELFDTNSNYDTSNYRFTPTIAGYYQVNTILRSQGATFTLRAVGIYKNNIKYSSLSVSRESSSSAVVLAGSNLIYMNGSTDYLEMFGILSFSSGTARFDSDNAADTSYFSAFLARAA